MNKILKRSSNIELLRIVAMLMIVFHHIVVHCINTQLTDMYSINKLQNGFFNYPFFFNRVAVLNFAYPLGPIANELFLIISGYFMANKEPKTIDLSRIVKKLITQLGFASVFLILISNIFYFLDNSNYTGLLTYKCFNDLSWFIGYYFLVLIVGKLILNRYLLKWKQNIYLEFLFVLLGLSQFSWANTIVNNIVNGFDILLIGVFFYALGGYIKRYDPFSKIRSIVFVIVILICFFAVYLNIYDITVANIQNFIANGSSGDFIQTIDSTSTNSIIVVLITISVFELFRRIDIRNNKFINFIGSSTFMVYLIHDNSFFYTLWNKTDWISLLNRSLFIFILHWSYCVLFVFVIGILCYCLYNMIIFILPKIKFVFVKNSE